MPPITSTDTTSQVVRICRRRATPPSRAFLPALALACSLVSLACATGGSSGGGGTEGTGGTGGSGGDEAGDDGPTDPCGAIEPEEIDCNEVKNDAYAAPQIAGCDGASVAPPQTPHPLGLDESDLGYFPYPGPVTETDPAVVGVWTELVDNEGHLPIHSIHRPTGKFLQFGAHETGGAADDKMVWYPPMPCSPFDVGIANCDTTFDVVPATPTVESHVEVAQADGDPDMSEVNLFCSGHVNLPPWDASELFEPATLTVGGSQPSNPNIGQPGSFLFSEQLPASGPPSIGDYAWAELDDLSSYRWYPGAAVLASGSVAVPGGIFQNTGALYCQQGPNQPQQSEGDCACDPQDPQDFFTANGICSGDGFCVPDDAVNADLGFQACILVDETSNGLDVGTRTSATAVEWQAYPISDHFGVYPQLFVLPDLPVFATSGTNLGGKLANIGSDVSWMPGSEALLWDPSDPSTSQQAFGGPSCTRGSSAVMYADDKIMKFGGPTSEGASRMTEVLDLSQACPRWRRPEGSELGMPRRFSQGVLLPNGETLALGGTASGNLGDNDDPETPVDETGYAVFTTERFDPLTETWCRLADLPGASPTDPPIYRGYHSQSFLLPDGRVYLGSGGATGGDAVDHYDYLLYAPPYLFWGPRPDVWADASESVVNDIAVMTTGSGTFRLARDPAVPIERVTLVKLSSTTHQFDQEQRIVDLEIVDDDANWIDVAPPPSTCYATPGYYMLFALSSQYVDPLTQETVRAGIPSIGFYVVVTGTCEAAEEPASVPLLESPSPVAVNDLLAAGARGLRVSCGGEGSTLDMRDLRQPLLDLCVASNACPLDGTVQVEARFLSTTGQASADPQELLDTATIAIRDGIPVFTNALVLDVSGTEFNSSIPLGPGDHMLELCGTLAGLSACIEQPLRIDPVLAGDDGDVYRASAIEPRPIAVEKLVRTEGLALGDDGVAQVDLPDEFVFPFYGEEVRTLWVGANGAVRIDQGIVPATNGTLPLTGAPHLAVYWDDLDPSLGGRVLTYYDGLRFVVAWENVPTAAGGVVSAQLHIFADGRIEMHYPRSSGGASPHGAGATIGIQHGGEGLLLSLNDDSLLTEARAFAIDGGSCIASQLRLLDSTPCVDRVATVPAEVGICAGDAAVELAVPPVGTVCAPHPDALVTGEVVLDGQRQPVAEDGSVRLFVGDYAAEWTMRIPEIVGDSATFLPTGQLASQPLSVRLSDAPSLCCRDEQTAVVLTSRDDFYDPRTEQPYCVAAQAGADTVRGLDENDTLLGHDGADLLSGNGGEDVLLGGAGGDQLWGGAGDDVLLGGSDADLLEGEGGNDEIWGGNGDDYLKGGSDDDVLLPGPGEDVVDAGTGDDQIVVLHLCEIVAGDELHGGDGTDTLWLPTGVGVADLENLGAIIDGIEAVEVLEGGMWGEAECELNP